MDCSDARKILNEHIEGTRPPAEQALIEEHLRSCEQCMLYAAEIKKTIETLQGLDEVEPPAWLTAKVMKKIRNEALPKKLWTERLFFPLHIKLPIEAFAALLITVAAIFIYKSMGPELRQMEIQPQAPSAKSMPAKPETNIQKKEMQQPQSLRKEEKQKDRPSETGAREIMTYKEEKLAEQPLLSSRPAPSTSPIPAPESSFAPSPAPSPAMRQTEMGKASGMAARDEVMQRAAPDTLRSELTVEKKSTDLAAITITVKALEAAKKELEIYLSRNNGEMKILEQSESRMVISVKLEQTRTDKFLAHLDNLGKIQEDRQALSRQSGLFKLIIEKQ